ncbi:MAG: M56 family metallopeptidase [Pseudobdellovibrio sp.]
MSQFLFFMTVLSFFYFLIISTSSKAFKYYSATKKVQAIKASLLFVTLALIGAWTYFYLTDGDLIADCFGRLNDQDGLTRVIGIVWFGVFSLLIARDVLNYRKRIKLLQSSVLKSRSFRNIGYFEVENSVEPVVAGLWKPQIYIPEGISKNSEALKLILSHEFIHLKNKDGLWSFLNLLIHRLNWHNPMALVSMSQIKIQMEMATDEEAVQEFKLSISDYAGQLVQLITKNQKSSLFMMNMSSTFSQM